MKYFSSLKPLPLRIYWKYLIAAIFLFLIEVYIGACVFDDIIRPFGGDYLVVILLYCMLKSISNMHYAKAALGVLCFSFLVEFLQYFKIATLLGLKKHPLLYIIVGNSFSWYDMLAYILGIATVLIVETVFHKMRKQNKGLA